MALYPSDIEKEAVKQKLVVGGYIKRMPLTTSFCLLQTTMPKRLSLFTQPRAVGT